MIFDVLLSLAVPAVVVIYLRDQWKEFRHHQAKTRARRLHELAQLDAFLGLAFRTCRFDELGRVAVLHAREFRQ